MDADTLALLRESLRSLLESDSTNVVSGLDDLGWDDVVVEDEAAATQLLFTEQGRAATASRALDFVITRAMYGGDHAIAATAPIVYPLHSAIPTSRGDSSTLVVDGVLLADAPREADLLVPVCGPNGVDLAIVDTGSNLLRRNVQGFDPAARLVHITGQIDDGYTLVETTATWDDIRSAAHRALASELVGAGRAMLELAVLQISERVQFSRPIGANQSPRHRLAEAHVALSAAQNLVDQAWTVGTPWASASAKAFAGSAADVTSRACLQVCGAIGLTFEHRLSTYVRRCTVLDALLGGWREQSRQLGAELLRTRSVPTVAGL
ncbi:acyl-CoA dehydrogenase family protein [Rhodococcus wratislaviensis]|uniref:acyl-CoA dehydrogenase family protein n=1 Tax=Rhodococcus wratislaviensis TaxID=44752 RepID=UPI000F575712|nr:acyl-CoA dehydrogenase family protein [Rhodococcus wratislaviensis]